MTRGARLLDRMLAAGALALLSPVLFVVAVAIKRSDPGPVFYLAERVGLGGHPFVMFKFRTMRVATAGASRITAEGDPRVFRLGVFLRKSKLDELPQLVNVLRGEMAIVGPRPEDPQIVARHYTEAEMETLSVLPGLTSPGTIYYHTHCQRTLDSSEPEHRYAAEILPTKLALDRVYVSKAGLRYDLSIVGRTVWVLVRQFAGRHEFPDPPEMRDALTLLAQARTSEGESPRGQVQA